VVDIGSTAVLCDDSVGVLLENCTVGLNPDRKGALGKSLLHLEGVVGGHVLEADGFHYAISLDVPAGTILALVRIL